MKINFKRRGGQYDEIWSLICQILTDLRIKYTGYGIFEKMSTNPNYPNMLSVVQILEEYGIKAKPVKLDHYENIFQLTSPFVVHFTAGGGVLRYIQRVDENRIYYSIPPAKQLIEKKLDEIWPVFQGNVILLTPPDKINQPESNFKRNFIFNLFYKYGHISLALLLLVLAICTMAYSYLLPDSLNKNELLVLFGTQVLSFLGIGVSLMISNSKNKGFIAEKICSPVKNSDCNAVLDSRYGSLFNYFKLGKLSLIYFLSSFLCLSVFPSTYALHYLCIIDCIGLVAAIWSFYTQIVVLKKLCNFCLLIDIFLVAKFTLSVYLMDCGFSIILSLSYILSIMQMLLLQVICFYGYFFVEYHLHSNPAKNLALRQNRSIKENEDIFEKVNSEEQLYLNLPETPIFIGCHHRAAKNHVFIITQPGCDPCRILHTSLNTIHSILVTKSISIRIIFFTNTQHPAYNNVLTVCSLFLNEHSTTEAIKSLSKIYDYPKKELHLLEISRIEKLKKQSEEIIGDHTSFCYSNNIEFTPTIIFNGRKVNEIYSIIDLINLL